MGIVITYLRGDRAVLSGGARMIETLARPGAQIEAAWLDRPGSGMDRSGLPSQRRFSRGRNSVITSGCGGVAHSVFVQTLLDRRAAVASTWPRLNGGAKTYRISNKAIYRALGVEDIRHRREASKPVVMRRLLSLDFVLEHPGMNWLPAEPEKVEFFEKLSLPRRLIPRRIYYGVAGNQKRYFALKLPLAADPKNRHLCLRRSGPLNHYRNSTRGEPRMGRFGMRFA